MVVKINNKNDGCDRKHDTKKYCSDHDHVFKRTNTHNYNYNNSELRNIFQLEMGKIHIRLFDKKNAKPIIY